MQPDDLASMVDCPMLTLRPTGLSSPAYRNWLDYVIVEDGRNVGRLYEDRHSPPEYRWFWSITVYVNPKLGVTTSGRPEPRPGQSRIPSQLAEVPQRLNSWSRSLYLAGNVEFAFTYSGQEKGRQP